MADTMDTNKENIKNVRANVVELTIVSKMKLAKIVAGLPNTMVHDGYPFTRKKNL